MALKIAIASGKGGTGKTSVAVNLLNYFARTNGHNVQLVDCDVEEPNAVLFFPDARLKKTSRVYQEIPVIDTSRCTFCRNCVDYCEFNAILVMPPVKFAEVNSSLCHSCGACFVACDQDALWVKEESIGTIKRYELGPGKSILEGTLNIGSAMQTMTIRDLKKAISPDSDIVILDAPPGTSCPVVESISDTDFVILVTEPTPFGFHDLKLTIALVREMSLPFGVVVNKANLGNREVHEYLEKEKIDLLGEIPFNRSYASSYAKGQLFSDIPEEVDKAYACLCQNLTDKIMVT